MLKAYGEQLLDVLVAQAVIKDSADPAIGDQIEMPQLIFEYALIR